MRFKLTIVSIHVAKVQFVRYFNRRGLRQLQNNFVTDKDLRGQNVLLPYFLV